MGITHLPRFGPLVAALAQTPWFADLDTVRLARMRFPLLVAILAAALVAVGAPPAAAAPPHEHAGASVSILVASYGSASVDVLAGDTVTWHNASVRSHTVTAVDGSWASERIGIGGMFSHQFTAPGVVAYYCQVHPFMRAQVDVHRVLLDAPRSTAPGQSLVLTGRAAAAAGTAVSIQAADGSPAVRASVDAAGRFSAAVTPRASTSYRAVVGGEASPPVQLLVLNRTVTAKARPRHGRVLVSARVTPSARGAHVVLQYRLKERFGWWPVRTARLDRRSRASFNVAPRHAVRARVVLVADDLATPLARSAPFRIQPR
jgi:plastocyanin